MKTQIVFTKHSPYYILRGENIIDDNNNAIQTSSITAFCRCGRSKTMPYCDNNHHLSKFEDGEYNSKSNNQWKNYTNDKITVYFNLSLCSHSGLCVKLLPTVFDVNSKPWINIKESKIEEIIEVISNCPSGALIYKVNGVIAIDSEEQTLIKFLKDGPIEVRGDVELIDDQDSANSLLNKQRYTLCRCGKSKNKPFCDGEHTKIYKNH